MATTMWLHVKWLQPIRICISYYIYCQPMATFLISDPLLTLRNLQGRVTGVAKGMGVHIAIQLHTCIQVRERMRCMLISICANAPELTQVHTRQYKHTDTRLLQTLEC